LYQINAAVKQGRKKKCQVKYIIEASIILALQYCTYSATHC
jgi:hypothetical protein